MARNWSRAEVEATVADYLAMFDFELRRVPFSKSEHRRQLARLLDDRSAGAIERKHQNVSAVLLDLGFPYIPGYKPLRNYQQLLADVVADRVAVSGDLTALVAGQVASPASLPMVNDILAARVDPPVSSTRDDAYPRAVRDAPAPRIGVNYLAIEARNRSLGSTGENFVVDYERARLRSVRRERLAERVEHVSTTRGDGLGFDVLSFMENGDERLIEVKTTAYGPLTPFFVTPNELTVSQRNADRYSIYRVFDFRRDVKLFVMQGSIDASFLLEPSEYRARVV